MDELEKLMLELGTENYEDDTAYIKLLLEKEQESKDRVLQMIALLLVSGNKRTVMRKIHAETDNLFGFLRSNLKETLESRFFDTYNHTTYNIFKTVGGKEFEKPALPDMNWHITKQSYLDDLKYYENRLKYDLKIAIDRGLVLKAPGSETANIVSKPFKALNNSTKGLVDTELTYVERQANSAAYEDQGADEYKFVATLDTVTCETCAELDGKIFKLSEKEVGVNYPPMHKFCRCAAVGNFDYTERMAKDKDGKPIYVKAETTYKEWLEKYGKV